MAWQPWLSKSQTNNLDVCQNKALRMITRQAKSAPVESLRRERQVPSISSVIDTTCETAREKALRYPADHPTRVCLDAEPVTRLKSRTSCRSRSIELSSNLPPEATNRRMFKHYTVPPWDQDLGNTTVNCQLQGICRHRMRTHIHIHASIHISIDIHIYICMHTHIRTCRYVHVCFLHLAHTNNRLKEGASPMHLWHAKHAAQVYAFHHAPT